MAHSTYIALAAVFALAVAAVHASDTTPIPTSKGALNTWFNQNIRPFSERIGTLDAALVEAEQTVRIVKVRKNGSGDFKTIKEAVKTVPAGNTERVIIDIGPGEYNEKVLIDFNQPFVSLVGYSPSDRPTITYAGTAQKYGTVDSATVIVLGQYFVAANLIIKNSAPRPDPYKKNGQALALRINGDKGAFFNIKFIGYQDTLCDDRGFHFFKDCYIQGTVDFIFGRGTSLYVNAELYVVGDRGLTVITAQGRSGANENTGYSFAHSKITGTGKGTTYLGRPWGTMPRVIYAYTEMTSVVDPDGWSMEGSNPGSMSKLYYGEYQSTGAGASTNARVKYGKQLSYNEVKPFITLGYIKASSWLLPPPKP